MQDTKREKAVIGARLRQAREQVGITKEEAAGAAGAQVAAITAWERGSSLPTLPQLKGLLACYGVSCYELLFGASPITLEDGDEAELRRVSAALPPRLRAKIDLMLTLTARPRDRRAVTPQ